MEKTALKKPFDKVVSLVKEVSLPKGEKPEPGSDPNKKLSDQQEKVRQLSVSSTVVQEQQVPDETHKVDVIAELQGGLGCPGDRGRKEIQSVRRCHP